MQSKSRVSFLMILFIFLFNGHFTFGQKGTITVTGKIADGQSKQPVELASVILTCGDTVVATSVTNRNGIFSMEHIFEGEYRLKYTFIGYEKAQTDLLTISSGSGKYDLGTFELVPAVYRLDEVNVVGEQAGYSDAIDRRVYRTNHDLISSSGTVSDLLQNVPSVSVDLDGNISFRGSRNVMMLIDGQPYAFNGSEGSEILQQMPANNIDRIEVMSNPSVRYRPDGTAGIINIVRKKNTKQGVNGSLMANAGNQQRYNASLLLNSKLRKWNLYGSYGIRRDHKDRYNADIRTLYDTSSQVKEYQDNRNADYYKPLSHHLRIGSDYEIDSMNQAGLSIEYTNLRQVKLGDFDNNRFDALHVPVEHNIRHRSDSETIDQGKVRASYKHRFRKNNAEIEMSNMARPYHEKDTNYYHNEYLLPQLPTSYDNKYLEMLQFRNSTSIDYQQSIGDKGTLEAGYNGYWARYDQTLNGESSNDGTHWSADEQIGYHFSNRQSIQALYLSFSNRTNGFSYTAGIRGEHAINSSGLMTLDSLISTNTLNLYPTLQVKKKLNDRVGLAFNYNRRVNRPNAYSQNPFPEYRDPRNLRVGNPKLLPEYTNTAELGTTVKWEKTTLMATAYYRYEKNSIADKVDQLNDSTWITTHQNLAYSQSAGMEFIGAISIPKLLNANLSSNIHYNQINAENLGLSSNKAIVLYDIKANFMFRVSGTTGIQLSATYYSPKLTPQGYLDVRKWVNLGLRQDVFDKRASITFTVSDVFNTMSETIILDTPTEYRQSIRRRTYRVIYAGFVYRFGQISKKDKDTVLQFDDKI